MYGLTTPCTPEKKPTISLCNTIVSPRTNGRNLGNATRHLMTFVAPIMAWIFTVWCSRDFIRPFQLYHAFFLPLLENVQTRTHNKTFIVFTKPPAAEKNKAKANLYR